MTKSALATKATRSLRRAVRKVVQDRARSGEPIAVWQDGRAVWVRPAKEGTIRNRKSVS